MNTKLILFLKFGKVISILLFVLLTAGTIRAQRPWSCELLQKLDLWNEKMNDAIVSNANGELRVQGAV